MPKVNWYDVVDELGWPKKNPHMDGYPAYATGVTVAARCNGKTAYQDMCWQRQIKNVIFNDPATIVYWHDGTKTVVKCQDGDKFDPEKGLAMAICKKFFGNRGNYNNVFKKYVREYYKKEDTKK